jgi:hypothetical protein
MNSSQLNFFIFQDDGSEIENFFRRHSVEILKYHIHRDENRISKGLPTINERVQYKIGLTRTDFMNDIDYKYDVHSKGYELDTLKSCAIEFDTGGFYPYSNQILQRARFYCVYSYYDNGENLMIKRDDFKECSGQRA